jgi:type IV pilus assembly protein PilB
MKGAIMPGISTRELEKFSRKFGKMLGSGIPLVKSLTLIQKENETGILAGVLEKVTEKLREGHSFSGCLEMFPGVFTEVYVAMVRAAENQGNLDSGMVKIADNLADGTIEAGDGEAEFIETQTTANELNLKVIRFVNSLITEAHRQQAAEILFKPESDKVQVFLGNSSNLNFQETITKDFYDRVIARVKLMSCLDISERRLPQDGRILVKVENDTVDIRTQTLPTVFGEQIMMFFINKKDSCIDPEKVFPDADDRNRIKRLIENMKSGLIVFSGPSGSGKTTSLYTAANLQNDGSKSIISIESQVYYTFEGISHIQTRPWIGLTSSAATRAALRAEPHILILDSLTDEETAKEAFYAAGNGVTVFTQMAARNPSDVFKQFLNLKVSPHLLYGGMGAVIFQVLVRKLCPDCSKKVQISHKELEHMGLSTINPGSYNESTGCQTCNNTGYLGRVPLYEIIIPDKNLKDVIIKGDFRVISEEIERMQNDSFRKKLQKLVVEGVTSISEMLRIQGILNPEL